MSANKRMFQDEPLDLSVKKMRMTQEEPLDLSKKTLDEQGILDLRTFVTSQMQDFTSQMQDFTSQQQNITTHQQENASHQQDDVTKTDTSKTLKSNFKYLFWVLLENKATDDSTDAGTKAVDVDDIGNILKVISNIYF